MLLHPPEPEEVYRDLAAFFVLCWQAIEAGAGEAAKYFAARNRNIDDGGLAAHLTRYTAKLFLDAHQTEVEFDRDDLAFSGLLVRLVRNGRAYTVRIRRSLDGTLPFPETEALRAFYKQPRQQYLPGIEPTPAQSADLPETHLMLLWRTPADYSTVVSLTAWCPKSVSTDEVRTHWGFVIPHPLTTTAAVVEEQVVEDLEISDLPEVSAQGQE